jgi:LuxR family quorum-sensing system transcriptional regulator CciR
MHALDDQLARRAFDCIADMKRAETGDDLSETAAPLFEGLGLPFFALARFFRLDGAPDVAILAGTFHSEWASRYLANRYVRHSQIARETIRTRDPYSWGDVMRRRAVDERQKRIKEEAREFGLADGLFTPLRWIDGSYAAVVLSGPTPELQDPFVRTTAGVLSTYYAGESRRLAAGSTEKKFRLSPRQRECLAWVRQGKSSGVIAEILGLSVETVDEHLSEACRKLRVRTRVQAAVEAALAGLID